MSKTVVTITGIRPDFIRMCKVFEKLDEHFNHILIHTGQHYDDLLSDVFFQQLHIRKPDYVLETGRSANNHYEQLSYLSTIIPRLLKENNILPDLILFLGDSNSVGVSFPLKKEGYRIGHIEAGMRSYDRRMLEEINRTVCDHCSDILFVYHEDYKQQLLAENITKNVFVVGNTIVEPFQMFREEIMSTPKKMDMILVDIHRPENFNHPHRLRKILEFANLCNQRYKCPVKLLYFKRLQDQLLQANISLGAVEMIPLLPFKEYLQTVYNCLFLISDSGTGQEEPALLNTPVVVPRDFTERPQSYQYNCSYRLDVDGAWDDVWNWLEQDGTIVFKGRTEWLGSGETSDLIVTHIDDYLNGE